VIRPLPDATEATSILDALDVALGAPGDPLKNGRRYTVSTRTQTDRATAVATLKAELDRINATWPNHVAIRGLN
jgi:hypothetical protein